MRGKGSGGKGREVGGGKGNVNRRIARRHERFR